MWDVNRQGQKISDVLPKAVDGLKLNASDAYKQGLLHIGSALLAGGVLAARSATGGNSPADNAGRVAAGMQFAGLITEGGTKYAKEAGYGMTWKPTPIDPNKPQGIGDFPTGKMVQNTDGLNRLGNLGKIVGGAGSFIGGVFGLISGVNSAFAGDKVNAGFSLTSGAWAPVRRWLRLLKAAPACSAWQMRRRLPAPSPAYLAGLRRAWAS